MSGGHSRLHQKIFTTTRYVGVDLTSEVSTWSADNLERIILFLEPCWPINASPGIVLAYQR